MLQSQRKSDFLDYNATTSDATSESFLVTEQITGALEDCVPECRGGPGLVHAGSVLAFRRDAGAAESASRVVPAEVVIVGILI